MGNSLPAIHILRSPPKIHRSCPPYNTLSPVHTRVRADRIRNDAYLVSWSFRLSFGVFDVQKRILRRVPSVQIPLNLSKRNHPVLILLQIPHVLPKPLRRRIHPWMRYVRHSVGILQSVHPSPSRRLSGSAPAS